MYTGVFITLPLKVMSAMQLERFLVIVPQLFVCYFKVTSLEFSYSSHLLEHLAPYDSDIGTTVHDSIHWDALNFHFDTMW